MNILLNVNENHLLVQQNQNIHLKMLWKAMQYAYRDRKNKKRTFRALWIQRINAGARLHGMSYSKFMGKIHANGIELNRKVLADLAMNHPEAFKQLASSLN